jgi:tetratricopeptide (TPR) repeat protein
MKPGLAIRLFLGDDRNVRETAVRRHLTGRDYREDLTAANWPFQRDVIPAHADAPVIWIRDLHLGFPAGQTPGTRLVLTQSTYQLQRWLDWLDRTPDVQVAADAAGAALQRSTPEAMAGRGPWGRIAIVHVHDDAAAADEPPAADTHGGQDVTPQQALQAAFRQPDPERRLEACNRAIGEEPGNPALLVAFASTCMELQLLDDAEAALARAASLASDWEAVHFERGKLLLRLEETERAAAAFTEAVRLMPGFAAALLNLGGALGELGRHREAQDVLLRALKADPRSHTALNNLGAVYREEGLLDEAARAFRGVIELAPAFVFGYYNLGQTLLLKGNVEDARRAYEEGFARDPQKNPRQACRLAVARAAAGDMDGARILIEMLAETLPRERRAGMFEEAESTLGALSTRPGVNTNAIDHLRVVVRSYSS